MFIQTSALRLTLLGATALTGDVCGRQVGSLRKLEEKGTI